MFSNLNDWLKQDIQSLQQRYNHWLSEALEIKTFTRDKAWTKSLAVGGEVSVSEVQTFLGTRANKRKVTDTGNRYILREEPMLYNPDIGAKNCGLNHDNWYLWDVIRENTMS